MDLGVNRSAGLAETCGFSPRFNTWVNLKYRRSPRALRYVPGSIARKQAKTPESN